MRLSKLFSLFSLTTTLAIAPALNLPIQPLAIVAAQTTRPLAIFVDDGEAWQSQSTLANKLQTLNAEIWHTSHTSFTEQNSQQVSFQVRNLDNPDKLLLIEGQQTLNNIPQERPIFLIGSGLGASSVLKLLPLLQREVQLVALVNPSGNDKISYPNASEESDNVDVFLSYFQVKNAAQNSSEPCNSGMQCYEFKTNNNAATVSSDQWIQEDLAQQLDLALKPAIATTTQPRPAVPKSPSTEVAIRTANPSNALNWQAIDGRLKHISVGSDGEVWGVNNQDYIFRLNGNNWQMIDGRLKQISVGSSQHIWGVNSANQVFRWNGNNWDLLNVALNQVAVGNDGTVWGLNQADEIFKWDGSEWQRTNGFLQQIAVGNAQNVWGVNRATQIFQWNGSDWNLIGSGFKYVSVNAEGVVLGINLDNQLNQWNGSTWQPLDQQFAQISIGSAKNIWAVNDQDFIYRGQ